MRIVFLMGNGFDISLGLKTSYTDFHKYYTRSFHIEPCIKKLKRAIKEDLENWSDFEKAFGIYTKKIADPEEFDLLYDDILQEMQKYLKAETEKFSALSINIPAFINSLTAPDSFIREKRRIQHLFSIETIDIRIINFNYTQTIDIFAASARHSSLHRGRSIITIAAPQHIHGTLDGTMLFGVNDKSQIANTAFQNNDTIASELVKPVFNKKLGYATDDICLATIKEADLICIFGMSIGDTDQYWWTSIGDRIKRSGCYAILFYWDGKTHLPLEERYKLREEEKIKEMFLEKIGISKDSDSASRIFIGYNTSIFQNMIE